MLQKSNMVRTIEIFFINPSKNYSLMEISKTIKLAHTSVKKNLKKLIGEGLITKSIEKKGKRKFPIYKASLDSKNFKKYKIVYNLYSLLESGLIEFVEEKLMPKSIVLFGSYSRGEDIGESDIDLFVECNKEQLDLKSFEKKLGRTIQINFREDFTLYSKELKNNIINGITLRGFLEGYK